LGIFVFTELRLLFFLIYEAYWVSCIWRTHSYKTQFPGSTHHLLEDKDKLIIGGLQELQDMLLYTVFMILSFNP